MRYLLPLALIVAPFLAGCSAVSLSEPIGRQVELDEKEIDQIVGRWEAGDSVFEVKHLDGSRFRITEIKAPQEAKDEPENVVVTRTDKEHTYFHIEHTDHATGETRYMLMRLGIAGGRNTEMFDYLVLYMADPRTFAKAVEAGELKGTIKRNDADKPTGVKLTSSSADIEKWLAAQENEPFVLNHVFVARKVKKDD